jgi:hypothetical protein
VSDGFCLYFLGVLFLFPVFSIYTEWSKSHLTENKSHILKGTFTVKPVDIDPNKSRALILIDHG